MVRGIGSIRCLLLKKATLGTNFCVVSLESFCVWMCANKGKRMPGGLRGESGMFRV